MQPGPSVLSTALRSKKFYVVFNLKKEIFSRCLKLSSIFYYVLTIQ